MSKKFQRLDQGEDVYGNVLYKGKLLKDWQKSCNYQYTLGELYRMASEGADFDKMLSA